MSALLAVCLLINFIATRGSAVITNPTSTNGTGQYFNTINSSRNYEHDTIVCGTANCHIICDITGGCNGTTINASLSDSLTIQCTENSACHSLIILDGPTTNLDLYCNDAQSCMEARIDLLITSNINIVCNHSTTIPTNGACFHSEINATKSSTVNIDCIGEYSCNAMDIYCPNSGNCDVNCASSDSCFESNLYIPTEKYEGLGLNCNPIMPDSCNETIINCMDDGLTTFISYDAVYSYWNCGTFGCCPFREGNITCSSSTNCVVCFSEPNK